MPRSTKNSCCESETQPEVGRSFLRMRTSVGSSGWEDCDEALLPLEFNGLMVFPAFLGSRDRSLFAPPHG